MNEYLLQRHEYLPLLFCGCYGSAVEKVKNVLQLCNMAVNVYNTSRMINTWLEPKPACLMTSGNKPWSTSISWHKGGVINGFATLIPQLPWQIHPHLWQIYHHIQQTDPCWHSLNWNPARFVCHLTQLLFYNLTNVQDYILKSTCQCFWQIHKSYFHVYFSAAIQKSWDTLLYHASLSMSIYFSNKLWILLFVEEAKFFCYFNTNGFNDWLQYKWYMYIIRWVIHWTFFVDEHMLPDTNIFYI